MSVITPILDTLLHQVLGRRADIERVSILKPDAPLTAIVKAAPVRDAVANDDRQNNMPLSAGQGASHSSEKIAKGAAYYSQTTPSSTPPSQQLSSSTSLHLSNEARTIASALGGSPVSPAVVHADTPLVEAGRTPVPPLLATVLRQHLSNSGIFYESHLVQWYLGQRSLEQLGEEPQTRLSFTANAPADLSSAEQPGRAAGAEFSSSPLGRSKEDASEDHGSTLRLVHESSLPLLRQQLELIGSQIFRWEGVAWPGTPLAWDVQDEGLSEEEDEAFSPVGEHRWSTTLNLSLPSLGELEIRMTLQGRNVQLQAWGADEACVEKLTSTAGLLRERFELSGLETVPFHFMTRAPQDNE